VIDPRNEERRAEVQDRLVAHLSPAAQEHFESLSPRDRSRQLWWWARVALQPRYGPQELQRFFENELSNDEREALLSLSRAEMEVRLEQLYLNSQLGLPEFGRGDFRGGPGPFGRGGRGPLGPEFDRDGPPRGPDGLPRDRRRFEGQDFDRRPPGPPPDGPRPEWRDWPPPPRPGDRRPPDNGPPPEDGPPPGPPPEEPV
jgi:hypothetical protein